MRCFVALWPDDAARGRLDALAHALHERWPHTRRMRRPNLHLTLAFIGELDEDRASNVAAQLAVLAVEPFAWTLEATGAFDGARVLWAGGAADVRLDALAARVRALLDGLRVHYDRKPFAAHVTLLRNLRRADAAGASAAIEPPIAWQVGQPVLVRSITDDAGTRYVTVEAPAAARPFGERQQNTAR